MVNLNISMLELWSWYLAIYTLKCMFLKAIFIFSCKCCYLFLRIQLTMGQYGFGKYRGLATRKIWTCTRYITFSGTTLLHVRAHVMVLLHIATWALTNRTAMAANVANSPLRTPQTNLNAHCAMVIRDMVNWTTGYNYRTFWWGHDRRFIIIRICSCFTCGRPL